MCLFRFWRLGGGIVGQYQDMAATMGTVINVLILAPLALGGFLVLVTLVRAVFTDRSTRSVIEKPRYFTAGEERNRVRAKLMEQEMDYRK